MESLNSLIAEFQIFKKGHAYTRADEHYIKATSKEDFTGCTVYMVTLPL